MNSKYDQETGRKLSMGERYADAISEPVTDSLVASERFEVESNVPNVDTISDFETYNNYRDAVAEVNEIADQWETSTGEIADRSWASRDNMYCAKCGNHYAAVVKSES